MSRAVLIPLAWAERLSAEALRTLVFLASYANRADGMCWPSNAELVRVIGKDERTIQRDLKTAEELGFIERIDGSGKNRRFRILTPEWFSQPRRGMSGLNDDNPDTGRRGKGGQPRHGASPNPDTGRRGIPDTGRRGPNKNIRIEHNQEHERESGSVSEESKPDFAGDVTAALALADLGRPPDPIPADILRMASAVGAENWIGQVRFQEIPFDDWRVRETLTVIQARGGNKGPNYAWAIFRGLPEKKPAAPTNGHANGKPANAEPRELVNARNALSMAERLLPKGESTPEEVERYRNKVETLARKAGMA